MLFAFMWKNQDTVWFKHCSKFYQLLDAQNIKLPNTKTCIQV